MTRLPLKTNAAQLTIRTVNGNKFDSNYDRTSALFSKIPGWIRVGRTRNFTDVGKRDPQAPPKKKKKKRN